MITLSRILSLALLLGLGACSNSSPGLWANTSSAEYASYCTIEFCDSIETSAEPECTCPCRDDSDDDPPADTCTGGDCPAEDDGGGYGCTLTQGYWKNHNEYETKPSQAIDWPAPLDESELLCGQKLLDILGTTPRGEAWYILAHQYIAASLNAANGAATDDLGTALADAEAILTANCDGITADRQAAIDLSYLLDSYNNGLIGPGHCD